MRLALKQCFVSWYETWDYWTCPIPVTPTIGNIDLFRHIIGSILPFFTCIICFSSKEITQ